MMDMANTSIDDDNEGVPGPGFEPGAEHLETVRAPDIEDEGEAAPDDLRAVGEDGHAIRPEPEMMDLAAFKALFRHIWNIPRHDGRKPQAVGHHVGQSRGVRRMCYSNL